MSDLARSSIDVNPHDLQEVLQVLNLYLPAVEVRAFGSRVKWTAKPYSDLDLALMTDHPLSLTQEAQLREAFDETTIPFKVDFVDWASTSKTFRKIIDSTSVVIRHASHTNAEHWAVMALDEALEALLDYRGKTPEKTTTGIPLITAKIVKNGRIESPTEFIASSNYSAWMTRGLPKAGDVVLTTEAPLGEVAQLNTAQVALAQRIVVLRGKPGVLDNTYLRYLLQTHEMQEQLGARATGTTVVGIKQSELRKIAMRLPPISQQLAVAKTLSGLDDKIELNGRMNETLEAMARAIFQSWFVDFDPVRAKASGESADSICQRLGLTPELLALFPDSFEDSKLGEIPAGWPPTRMDEVLELAYGKALKATDRIDGPVPVYGSGGITGYHNESYMEGPAVIVGRKGTVGSLYWEDCASFPIDTVFYVKPKAQLTYCYYLLQTLGLETMNTDAAVPGLNRNNVYRLLTPLSRKEIRDEFDRLAKSFRSQIHSSSEGGATLSNIRDALLPRLISGDLPAPSSQA